MKNTIAGIVIAVPIVLSVFYFVTAPKESELKSLTGQEATLISSGYNAVPKQQPTTMPVTDATSLSDSKMEIEISSTEILQADSDGLIGTNNPFNPRFITEQDVKDSINRILDEKQMSIEMFESDYQEYVINLRHMEMTDHIGESDSQVLAVASEYKTKLLTNQP